MGLKVIIATWNWLLDFFIPRSNINSSSIHSYLTASEIDIQNSRVLTLTPDNSQIFDQILVCSSYKNKLIHDLIFRTKFNGELSIINDLVNLLQAKIKGLPRPDIISFVPADPKRVLERGYHIPFKIAHKLSDNLNLKLVDLVHKNKSTKPQTSLDKKHRVENLKDVFELNDEVFKHYKVDFDGVIWLIDDIITTMTTISLVAKIIKQNYPKAKIIGIGIAG